jgi:phage baseplate assembly protein W
MQGMHRDTGTHLAGIEHIRQSVKDILSTPLRTRRMLMEYGSDLPYLVDIPTDGTAVIRVIMATAVALARWEPRISVNSVEVLKAGGGEVEITVRATDIETGASVILENITL